MDTIWKEVMWSQFAATIDMLGEAIQACPAELWDAPLWQDPIMGSKFSQFWYVAYHTLFWLDLYLTGSQDGFLPPAPFDTNELDPQGVLPNGMFTRDELQSYLDHCHKKCKQTVEQLTDGKIRQLCYFSWRKEGLSFAELLVDNMRHVQEHGAQLNMFLGQQVNKTAHWLAGPKLE